MTSHVSWVDPPEKKLGGPAGKKAGREVFVHDMSKMSIYRAFSAVVW